MTLSSLSDFSVKPLNGQKIECAYLELRKFITAGLSLDVELSLWTTTRLRLCSDEL